MRSFPFSENAWKPEARLAMANPQQGAEPREEGVEPRGEEAEAKEEGAEPREEGEAAIRASGVAAAGLGRATSALEALTGAQTTLCTTATHTVPSKQAAAISAPDLRKRGRPKGSKNKPKLGQPAAKQSRSTEQVSATQNRSTTPRRSLDKVLTEVAASAEVPQFVQGADTELPISAIESTVLPPTPAAVAPSGNSTVLPNEGLPDPEHSIATEPATPPSSQRAKRTPLPSVLSMYVDTLVAFSPAKKGFITQKKTYAGVGNAFLVGRVCRLLKRSLFQINWLDSQFQKHVETLNLSAVQRGNANYRSLHGGSTGVGWGRLCAVGDGEEVHVDDDADAGAVYGVFRASGGASDLIS
ncbi:hypothetical protein PR003_g22394 [Phytophthora rubi]|uniref:Uncharacterized protein n=1 Tax=Phytophthora rubi TaxID=129364 RepID=A0A6A4D4G4_9STRA|nr:hypothetical protein PR003_g22394 [Phytophthora rubi]